MRYLGAESPVFEVLRRILCNPFACRTEQWGMSRTLTTRRGLSLVELLVAIAIVLILAALVSYAAVRIAKAVRALKGEVENSPAPTGRP